MAIRDVKVASSFFFLRVRYSDFHLVYQINFPFDILDIWYASGKKKAQDFYFFQYEDQNFTREYKRRFMHYDDFP